MATYPQAQGFDLGSILQAAQLGRSLNPVNIQQEALNNQLALQLKQLQVQAAQQNLNDLLNPQQAINRKLQAELATRAALDPSSGFTYAAPGLANEVVQTPGALTDQQAALLETTGAMPNVPRGTPITPVLGVGGVSTGITRDLNSAIQGAQQESLINQILKPHEFDLSQGQNRYRYNPITGESQQIASNAPKGTTERPLQHVDLGTRVAFFDSAGNEIKSVDKQKDARYEIRKEGLYVEQTPGKGDFKFTSTVPQESTPGQQFQIDALDRSVTAIDDLIKRTNDSTTGRSARLQGSSFFPGVLQTDAYANYAADLDSIKSGVFLTQIAAMKASSKTGSAGLGAISNKEGDRLESAYASLRQNQSPDNVRKNLTIAKDAIQKYRDALTKYGNTPSAAPSQPITPSGPIKINSIRLKPQP